MEQKIVNILQDRYLKGMSCLKGDFNLLRCAILTVQNLFNILCSDLKIITGFHNQFEKDPYRVWRSSTNATTSTISLCLLDQIKHIFFIFLDQTW
jgi:hypothetical protein